MPAQPEPTGAQGAGLRAPHARPAAAVLAALSADEAKGLSDAEAAARLERHGPNRLAEAPAAPLWKKLLAQFNSLVIWILLVAAVIAGVAEDWPDAAAILAIVILNGLIGFIQEEKAERSLAALQKMASPLAKVLRAGALRSLPAAQIVPGDILYLEAGDSIPADARLTSAFGLRAQESALTGESVPVDKDPAAVLGEGAALGDRRTMVYMGTVAAAGKAHAVAVATGMQTEIGRIAGLLAQHEREPTPLQRRLSELGRVLVIVCLAIVAAIFALQMVRGGHFLEVLLVSVSLAVAAVPEGLPAVVTIALALGLQRMVKRNALIRKLPSVETLGSVTVICSDKTGTLTRNEMTVREVLAGGTRYQVSGAGYAPEGEFLKVADGPAPSKVAPENEPDLLQALAIGARCNNASVSRAKDLGAWQVVGDPTEGALLVAAMKAKLATEAPKVLHEIPFDSERKAMSVVVRENGATRMYSKGAPEVILAKCQRELRHGEARALDEARRREIAQASTGMAGRALRVLGLAYREVDENQAHEYPEEDLVFAGLAGMIDPPREEAKAAVEKCEVAGIRPVMITGDHPDTALAIGRELKIAREGAISGAELDTLEDGDLDQRLERCAVFARVSAEHKLRIVRAWKRRGQIVAMTGDGVNDAPAVKAADIGIAMGITGTDVTKEASDMVLTDDNFASIVNAVEEGRGILDNIRKVLLYLLSSNASEVMFMFGAALIGWPVPLKPLQILWINLVTDSLPALALATEPTEADIMRRPPRPPREAVLTWERGRLILYHGLLMALVSAIGFAWAYRGDPTRKDLARTVAFCVIAFAQLFYSVSCRSRRYTMPQLGPFTNYYLAGAIAISGLLQFAVVTLPFTQPFFGTVPLSTTEWLVALGLALTPVTLIEVAKLVREALGRTRAA